jgi:hypothetical protein
MSETHPDLMLPAARPEVTPETSGSPDGLRDPGFTVPERIPWSVLGPEFVREWGKAEPEHFEIVGPSGSGKTYLLASALQGRMIARHTPAVLICTKPADGVIAKLGWPVVDTWEGVRKNDWVVFWPKTGAKGTARKGYHNRKIIELLNELWVPDANTLVAFDEVGYVESLSRELRDLVQMYWREGRSQGITVCAMKQRPQGALRDMHSETYWTAAFAPNDRSDLERFAELFGARRDWMPVFDELDQERREFIIRHSRSREAYISWIDVPLVPVKPPEPERERRGIGRVLRAARR